MALRMVPFAVDAATRPSYGFVAYYTAARLLDEGAGVRNFYDDVWFNARVETYTPGIRDIYRPNPPTTAWFVLPLAGLDYGRARAAWSLVNLVALAAAVAWLLGQAALRGVWAPAFVALVLLYHPLRANLAQGQAYALLLGLLVLAWHGYRRRREAVVGLALGTMLAFKLAAPLVWVLLAVQRRWQALAWGAATALGAVLLSLPWVGADAWPAYLSLLTRLSDRPELAVTAYQSQFGLIHHLLAPDARWNPGAPFDAPALADWLTWLSAGLLIGVSAYRAHRAGTSDLIFGAFVILGIVVSPLSLAYHYVLLLLPAALLMAWAQGSGHTWATLILVAALAAVAADLPYRSPRLAGGIWSLLAYPKLYGAWALWGLALWATSAAEAERTAPLSGAHHEHLSGVRGPARR